METTVISDSVNLASRLEGLTREYNAGVIVSEICLNKLSDKNKYMFKLLDTVQVKGRQEAVSIYEILCLNNNFIKD
jgi:class 3 adenylate cyclase